MRLFYFPYDEGLETLPVPWNLVRPNEANEPIPLPMRKPGLEVFWNERLIKEAHLPLQTSIGFTKPGTIDGKKVEEKWYSRVKGMLFVNSDFAVTHNSKQPHLQKKRKEKTKKTKSHTRSCNRNAYQC
jgi:hypothetical protein